MDDGERGDTFPPTPHNRPNKKGYETMIDNGYQDLLKRLDREIDNIDFILFTTNPHETLPTDNTILEIHSRLDGILQRLTDLSSHFQNYSHKNK